MSIHKWALVIFLTVVPSTGYSQGPVSIPTVDLRVGDRTIHAETVSANADLARGLMFRKSLPANAGMLFVFSAGRSSVCMWMKDTTIPLSAAFLDRRGAVLKIADMQPLSTTTHCADGTRFVLEVNQGTFAAAGVKPGARIGGLPALPD